MQLLTKKFTIEQYHQMAENNIFHPEERLELIKGEIIKMSPVGVKHAKTVKLLNSILTYQLHNKAIIGVQDPIELNNNSEPEPDIRLHTLGESSVDFIVRPWVRNNDYWTVYWDITREVKKRFDAEGISIPFPQRDVHITIEDKFC